MSEVLDFVINLKALFDGNSELVKAGNTMSAFQSKVQKLQQVSGKISGYQKMSGSLQTAQQRMTQAAEKAQTLAQQISQSDQVTQSMRRQAERANAEYLRTSENYDKQRKSLEALREELQAAGVNVDNLAEEEKRLADVTNRLVNAQNNFNSIKKSLTFQNIKDSVFEPITDLIDKLKEPVMLSANFESAMARVKAVAFSGADADLTQFEAMKAQAAKLGADTQFTAIEAATAQENLARAGMSAPDIMGAMPALLNMTSAEGMDLGTASAIIAKGLGGMNLGGQYAGRLADILSYTSAASNTNIAMLGEAFKVAAPVAASQNISMEQLSSYLGVLANKGFEGSEAGHALSSSIQRLAKRPKEAADALNSLGVATRTKEGKMRELPDIMIALNESMKKRNLGENAQLELMSKIFGGNYGAQMMAFMQAAATGDADKMQNGVYNDSFGRAKTMADINLDTLNGQIAILGSAWDGLMTTVGDMFNPIARFGIETLSTILSKINEIMNEFPKLSKAVAFGFASWGISKSLIGLTQIGLKLVKFPFAWLEVQRATSAAGQAVNQVAGALGGAKNSAHLFGLSLNTALGYIGLIVSASVLIYENWEKITSWATKAGDVFAKIDRTTPISEMKPSMPDYHIRAMESAFSIPTLEAPKKKNALGGIYSRPIWTWAAEAGPEAIIPLTNKSRGIPLVMEAAERLGVTLPMNETVSSSILGSNTSSLIQNAAGNLSQNYSDSSSILGSNTSSLIQNVAGNLSQSYSDSSSIFGSNTSSLMQNVAGNLSQSYSDSSSIFGSNTNSLIQNAAGNLSQNYSDSSSIFGSNTSSLMQNVAGNLSQSYSDSSSIFGSNTNSLIQNAAGNLSQNYSDSSSIFGGNTNSLMQNFADSTRFWGADAPRQTNSVFGGARYNNRVYAVNNSEPYNVNSQNYIQTSRSLRRNAMTSLFGSNMNNNATSFMNTITSFFTGGSRPSSRNVVNSPSFLNAFTSLFSRNSNTNAPSLMNAFTSLFSRNTSSSILNTITSFFGASYNTPGIVSNVNNNAPNYIETSRSLNRNRMSNVMNSITSLFGGNSSNNALSFVNSFTSLFTRNSNTRNSSGGILNSITSLFGGNSYNTPGFLNTQNSVMNSITSLFGGNSYNTPNYIETSRSLNRNRMSNVMNSITSLFGGSTQNTASNVMNAITSLFTGNSYNSPRSSVLEASDNLFNTFTSNTSSPSLKELNNSVNYLRTTQGSSYSTNHYRSNNSPINITINVSGQDSHSQSVASDIAEQVRRALDDIMNSQERLAYA